MSRSFRQSPSRRDFLSQAGRAGLLTMGTMLVGSGAARRAHALDRMPNVLLIMSDEERDWRWLPKSFDFARHFPARNWLKQQGVRFTNYFVHTNPCSPSRSTIFTGQHTDTTSIFDNVITGYQDNMNPLLPTLGDMFKSLGYRTAYRGKWHLFNAPRTLVDYGFDDWEYDDFDDIKGTEGLEQDEMIAQGASDFIWMQAGSGQPWFMPVCLVNPHDIAAYPTYYSMECQRVDVTQRPDYEEILRLEDVPANCQDDLDKKPAAQKYWRQFYNSFKGSVSSNDKNAWRRMLNDYIYFMKRSDQHLLTVLNALSESGQLENTVIIFTSDHGEMGGSHSLRAKGPEVYDESRRVPLIIVDPRLPHDGVTQRHKGVETRAFGSAIDLAPTLLRMVSPGYDLSTFGLKGVDLYSSVMAAPDPSTLKETAARSSILFTYDAKQGAPLSGGALLTYGRGYVRGILGYDYRGNLVKFAKYFAKGGASGPLSDMHLELYDWTADGGPLEINNRLSSRLPPAPYKKVQDDMNKKLDALIAKEMRNNGASGLAPKTPWPSVGCK